MRREQARYTYEKTPAEDEFAGSTDDAEPNHNNPEPIRLTLDQTSQSDQRKLRW